MSSFETPSTPSADAQPPVSPGAPGSAQPPAKKSGTPVILWVLLGCGGLIFLMVIAFAALGFFVVKKVEEKVDIRDGKVTIRSDQGKVTFSGDDQKGSFKVESEDGTVTIGGGTDAGLPSWLPAYPGAATSGQFKTTTPKGEQITVSFTTANGPDAVSDFYEKNLKGQGFSVRSSTKSSTGEGQTVMCATEHADGRQVVVVAARQGNETTWSLSIVIPVK